MFLTPLPFDYVKTMLPKMSGTVTRTRKRTTGTRLRRPEKGEE